MKRPGEAIPTHRCADVQVRAWTTVTVGGSRPCPHDSPPSTVPTRIGAAPGAEPAPDRPAMRQCSVSAHAIAVADRMPGAGPEDQVNPPSAVRTKSIDGEEPCDPTAKQCSTAGHATAADVASTGSDCQRSPPSTEEPIPPPVPLAMQCRPSQQVRTLLPISFGTSFDVVQDVPPSTVTTEKTFSATALTDRLDPSPTQYLASPHTIDVTTPGSMVDEEDPEECEATRPIPIPAATRHTTPTTTTTRRRPLRSPSGTGPIIAAALPATASGSC